MAEDTTQSPQPSTPDWNPVDAMKQKYPNSGMADHEIAQNLQDPVKFRSAFPEYSGVTDADIQTKVGKFVDSHPEYHTPVGGTGSELKREGEGKLVTSSDPDLNDNSLKYRGVLKSVLPAGHVEKAAGEYAQKPITLAESENPTLTGMKKFGAGMVADTAHSLKDMFTSPLGLAANAAGPIAEMLPKVAAAAEDLPVIGEYAKPVAQTLAKYSEPAMRWLGRTAGAGMAGAGAVETYQGAKEGDPSKVLSGLGTTALGASGAFYPKGMSPEDHASATAQAQAKGSLPKIAVPEGIKPEPLEAKAEGLANVPQDQRAASVLNTLGPKSKPVSNTGEALATVPQEAPAATLRALGPKAVPEATTGEALGGVPLKSPLGRISTPAVARASESGEALANVLPSKSSVLGENKVTGERPAAETGEALGTQKVPDQPITKQTVEASRERLGMQPEKVGTAEGAKSDTALFQKAKEELGPDASISEVAKRAQELKSGYQGPERRAASPETFTGEERRVSPLTKSPFEVTEGASKTISADKNMPQHPAEVKALDHSAVSEWHNQNQGSTFNPKLGNLDGTDMYAVSVRPELGKILDGEKVTPEIIKSYIEDPKVAEALKSDPALSVGSWANEGKTYLDLSKAFSDRDEAIKFGKDNNQKAIFNLKTRDTIPTGGTGEIPTEAAKEVPAETKPAGLAEAEKRGLEHRIGKAAANDTTPEGVERAQRFLKVTNTQLADFANANGPDHPDGPNETWTAKDFSRSGIKGNELNPNKQLIFDHIQKNIAPAEFLEKSKDWGTAKKMEGQGPAPKATIKTARMSDAELKEHGFTQSDIDAGKHLPPITGGASAATALAKNKGIPEEISKRMTPQEIAGATKSPKSEEKFIENMSKIPEVQEYIDIALAGEGARKWYQRSSAAFTVMQEISPDYFSAEGDKDKFIGMMAGSSPRQSVAMNLRETLSAWKQYVDAGRPEVSSASWKEYVKSAKDAYKKAGEPEDKSFWDFKPTEDKWKTEKMLSEAFTPALSKVPNVIKALNGEDLWPDLTKNSNFKVHSFYENLRGWLNSVTNDGWMSLFAGLDPREISSPEAYHPMAVATRAAAEALGWEPAEAQAAIWSFTQALTERGETDPTVIRQYSEDFADLMAHDELSRGLLEDLGVNLDKLDERLRSTGEKPEVSGRTTATTSRSIGKLKGRIEEARGKGAIPPPKSAQGELGFREEHPVKADTGTEFNPETMGEPEQVSKNASGESAASQEAINRTASEKVQGIKTYRVDSRSGRKTLILGVDAADATAGPNEVIEQHRPDGTVVTLDTGKKARPLGRIKTVGS